MSGTDDTFTLATFNVHLGTDGWGRPFDVVGECGALDADVLIIQESWTPDAGRPSTAGQVAALLGYRVVTEVGLAHGLRFGPSASADDRWGPKLGGVHRPFRLDRDRRRAARSHDPTATGGQWGLALLARIPVGDPGVISLGQLKRDPARRVLVTCVTELAGRPVSVFGTHMSHLTHWSPAQYRRLAASLPPASTPAVLAGDMNLWGPPVSSFFPSWRRAVTGRTWPAERPHSQLDHVLVTPSLSVVGAWIAPKSGSDHRPVVVRLGLS